MKVVRRALAAMLVACSGLAGLTAPSSAATGYQVKVTQLADTLDAGAIQMVQAEVRDGGGSVAPDGTVVRFTTSGDDDSVVVPEFVGMAAHGTNGYWMAESGGAVFAFGTAPFAGDLSDVDLAAPVVGIASSGGDGYWLATADGQVYPFGDAGSTVIHTGLGGRDPVVGITSHGAGGWVVTANGQVAAFGSASHYGNRAGGADPVIGIVASDGGTGYRMFTAAGAVLTFGDAVFRGDMSQVRLNKAIAGLMNFGANSYLLVGIDGGIFNFSDRPFHGSLGANPPADPLGGIVAAPAGSGYWMFTVGGEVFPFGDSRHVGSYWQV
ncbi:MAG TPA: hypothetical protein VHH12_06665, partial [Mycobacterium sp.]|nr:hypothetical protein [Mycobacterium sp.]